MKRMDYVHPIILFLYFMMVIFITMITNNPVLISISFFSSLFLYAMFTSFKNMFKKLGLFLILMIFMALINPIFSRYGKTILFSIGYYNFTLESMLYGFFTSMMLVSVIIWFMSYSIVFKSDKFIYLFGKIIPKISLVISVTLNFIPRFTHYFKEIDDAQRSLGVYEKKALRMKLRVFSIVFGMSLESAIETSNSMRARGYGKSGRSNYSIFKWRKADLILGIIWIAFGVYSFISILSNSDYNYYPVLDHITVDLKMISICGSFLLLAISSTILEIKENILWHYLKLKN